MTRKKSISDPIVSVILSVYNAEKFIHQSVKSILEQSYDDIELIVINDGSTDKSLEILREFQDDRLIIYNQKNIGLTKSLNKAVSLAKGKYIARQDADDFSEPNRLELQIAYLLNNPSLVLVASDIKYFDQNGSMLYSKAVASDHQTILKQISKFKNPFAHGSIVFKKDAFEKIGGYNEAYQTSQDYDLITRMTSVGFLGAVQKTLYNLRINSSSVSIKKGFKKMMIPLKVGLSSSQYTGIKVNTKDVLNFILKKMLYKKYLSLFPQETIYSYIIANIHYRLGDLKKYKKSLIECRQKSFFFFPAWLKLIKLRNKVCT